MLIRLIIFEFFYVNDHETSSTCIIRRTFRRKNQNLDKLSIRAMFRFSRSLVFRIIHFPHRLVYYAFSYNLVNADSKKIRVCRRNYARSRGKHTLEATLLPTPYSFRDIARDKIFKLKVTTARSRVKSRSDHDVAHLHILTNVPTKYKLPTPYGF